MTSQEDQLRTQILSTLSTSGALISIRSLLRAQVFQAIQDTELSNHNNETKRNLKREEELLQPKTLTSLSLVADFLKFHGLTSTLSVLNVETSLPDNSCSIDQASSYLKRDLSAFSEECALTSLLPLLSSIPSNEEGEDEEYEEEDEEEEENLNNSSTRTILPLPPSNHHHQHHQHHRTNSSNVCLDISDDSVDVVIPLSLNPPLIIPPTTQNSTSPLTTSSYVNSSQGSPTSTASVTSRHSPAASPRYVSKGGDGDEFAKRTLLSENENENDSDGSNRSDSSNISSSSTSVKDHVAKPALTVNTLHDDNDGDDKISPQMSLLTPPLSTSMNYDSQTFESDERSSFITGDISNNNNNTEDSNDVSNNSNSFVESIDDYEEEDLEESSLPSPSAFVINTSRDDEGGKMLNDAEGKEKEGLNDTKISNNQTDDNEGQDDYEDDAESYSGGSFDTEDDDDDEDVELDLPDDTDNNQRNVSVVVTSPSRSSPTATAPAPTSPFKSASISYSQAVKNKSK